MSRENHDFIKTNSAAIFSKKGSRFFEKVVKFEKKLVIFIQLAQQTNT